MRRWVGSIAVVALGLVALGAAPGLASGFMGTDAPSRIPVPARVFSATFEDVGGVEVTGRRVTFDGEVFVHGRLGEGQVTVPFEQIREVRFEGAEQNNRRIAVIHLHSQTDPVRVVIKDDAPWFARARFGNYKIESRDLRLVHRFELQER
ncbi:MAG: hypothetical protein EA397_04010 [Deltaproteobacteria bacterium]|nr:MAG: hypothetical protein EA397_04010 [Deltaproteobacteria bacterium]